MILNRILALGVAVFIVLQGMVFIKTHVIPPDVEVAQLPQETQTKVDDKKATALDNNNTSGGILEIGSNETKVVAQAQLVKKASPKAKNKKPFNRRKKELQSNSEAIDILMATKKFTKTTN
ncbi:MAG: hypothetical protein HOJ48_17380 [Desulfobacula sp.]|jgi:F0F1-type ATP synthase epsilon subunit|nr:hypothetical protein [Desulfobacula sp.]